MEAGKAVAYKDWFAVPHKDMEAVLRVVGSTVMGQREEPTFELLESVQPVALVASVRQEAT